MHNAPSVVEFEVPLLPPTVNHYKVPIDYRKSDGTIVRSYARTPEANAFINAVVLLSRRRSLSPKTPAERKRVRYALSVTVYFGKGDRGDGDNFFKCIADGLTTAGVFHSDARVRSWHINVEDRYRDDPRNPRTLICASVLDLEKEPDAQA